ncbi:MAG TPA: nuclear transport factor 2 family protein [Candidatus Eisenbacteria bacterium]|nr:nuclear transport factor 2 family protein [Candidatus Eisenbacteria bacterium]
MTLAIRVVSLLVVFASWLVPFEASSAASDQPPTTSEAHPGTDVEDILAMERRIAAAFFGDDTKAFDELLADDFVYIGALGGKIMDRAKFLTGFREAKWTTKQYLPWDVRARTFGSVAVVTMRVDRVSMGPDGEVRGSYAVTRVWSRSNNAWRLSVGQMTEIPPDRVFRDYADPADTTALPPPQSPQAAAILALEERFKTGFLTRDEKVILGLMADDFIHIGLEGEIVDKTVYMKFFKRGKWRYEKYEPWDVKVRTYGSAAIVTGRVERLLVVEDRRDMGAFAFTHVWHHSNGAWRLVSSHVTLAPPSSVD